MNMTEVNKFLKPQTISIQIDQSRVLNGDLTVPDSANALVVLANGRSHSRHTSANLYISRALTEKGMASLIIDLFTEDEQLRDIESDAKTDPAVLEERIVEVIDWLSLQNKTNGMKIGLFGTDITAAGMVLAAVRRYKWISTVVSANGRPDLAGRALSELDCPILLIVGELKKNLLRFNKKSLSLVTCQKELLLVRGSSSRFEEPGAVEELADLAISWFQEHLV